MGHYSAHNHKQPEYNYVHCSKFNVSNYSLWILSEKNLLIIYRLTSLRFAGNTADSFVFVAHIYPVSINFGIIHSSK